MASTAYKLSGWRWNKPLHFGVNPTGGPASTVESVRAAIATIEGILDTPLDMAFDVRRDITKYGYDFNNLIKFEPLTSGTLGLAKCYPSLIKHSYGGRSWYTAREGDIRINSLKKWNTSTGPDLRTVLMHEIIHILGLNDLGYATNASLMTTYSGPKVPGPGDIAGLKILYG